MESRQVLRARERARAKVERAKAEGRAYPAALYKPFLRFRQDVLPEWQEGGDAPPAAAGGRMTTNSPWYREDYDPDLHGELTAPAAQRTYALVFTLVVVLAVIGVLVTL